MGAGAADHAARGDGAVTTSAQTCRSCGTHYDVAEVACPACGVPSEGWDAADESGGVSGATMSMDGQMAPLSIEINSTIGVAANEIFSGGSGVAPDFFAPLTIGRAPDNGHVIVDPGVSGHHVRVSYEADGIHLEDLDSANGTFVDGRRIKRVVVGWDQPFVVSGHTLTARAVVQGRQGRRMGEATSMMTSLAETDLEGPTVRAGPAGTNLAALRGAGAQASSGATRTDWAEGQVITVGRDATCDIVLDTPNVSRVHARLERTRDGFKVQDLGSTNGTWVSGERISGVVQARTGDDIRVGPHRLDLSGGLQAIRSNAAHHGVTGVRLDATNLVRNVGDPARPIKVVDGVSFSILPGEMVAIMGPSGAGKTSVLTTIAGYTPPSGGTVSLDGLSLYRHYDVFRRAIGYVPQDDVMHRVLTVEEVLYYHGRIHFAPEYTDREIMSRIDTVLHQLDLSGVRNTLIGDENRRGLSGGQRKRVNVAMELLSQPSLLVLDEPTSGLDARSAYQLIRICRDLASEGRTVAMTIHQPRREAFELFDKLLLLAKGGKLAYFGATQGCRAYFMTTSTVPPETAENPADYALDVLDPLDPAQAQPAEHWEQAYARSPEHRRFIVARQKKEDLQHAKKVAKVTPARAAAPVQQLVTLVRRYALLKWRDRGALAVQMAQAPVIAALGVVLFWQGRFEPMFLKDDVTPSLFILAAGSVWFGCSNVAREIVGERAIYQRERMGSLRAGPYLLSKVLVQGGLIFAQVAILLLILAPAVGLQGSLLGLVGVPVLAGWASMCLGFLISAIARTELQSIQYVPLAILPQIMLSGVLLPVSGETATTAAGWLSKPALMRWAYGALLKVEYVAGNKHGQKLWKKDGSDFSVMGTDFWKKSGFGTDELAVNVLVLSFIGLACGLATWRLLLRRRGS